MLAYGHINKSQPFPVALIFVMPKLEVLSPLLAANHTSNSRANSSPSLRPPDLALPACEFNVGKKLA